MNGQFPDEDPNFGGVETPADRARATYGGVPTSQAKPQGFSNGLTAQQEDEIDDLTIMMSRVKHRIEVLGSSRCYLEEAQHWLRFRKINAA